MIFRVSFPPIARHALATTGAPLGQVHLPRTNSRLPNRPEGSSRLGINSTCRRDGVGLYVRRGYGSLRSLGAIDAIRRRQERAARYRSPISSAPVETPKTRQVALNRPAN